MKSTKNYIFNLSGDKLASIFEILKLLKGLSPEPPIEVGPRHLGEFVSETTGGQRYRIVVRPAFDIYRAREELGHEL